MTDGDSLSVEIAEPDAGGSGIGSAVNLIVNGDTDDLNPYCLLESIKSRNVVDNWTTGLSSVTIPIPETLTATGVIATLVVVDYLYLTGTLCIFLIHCRINCSGGLNGGGGGYNIHLDGGAGGGGSLETVQMRTNY